jgi:hypothetical protein
VVVVVVAIPLAVVAAQIGVVAARIEVVAAQIEVVVAGEVVAPAVVSKEGNSSSNLIISTIF